MYISSSSFIHHKNALLMFQLNFTFEGCYVVHLQNKVLFAFGFCFCVTLIQFFVFLL